MMRKDKGFAPIIILIVIVVIAAIAGSYYLGNKNGMREIISFGTPMVQTSTTPVATADPAVNWKVFHFSQTISFKTPSSFGMAHVNVGHYAQEGILPNNTKLQIWGADGDSPTGGKDYYANIKQALTTSPVFQTVVSQLDNREITIFISKLSSTSADLTGLVWGGDVPTRISGVVFKMDDGRAFILIHYKDQTSQGNSKFDVDEMIFDQILSTFKFTN
jgi:hypothetical protein